MSFHISRAVLPANLQGTDRIVKRLERFEGAEFNHGRVAGYFLANQATILPTLSAETVDRFEALITALSKALPQAIPATTSN